MVYRGFVFIVSIVYSLTINQLRFSLLFLIENQLVTRLFSQRKKIFYRKNSRENFYTHIFIGIFAHRTNNKTKKYDKHRRHTGRCCREPRYPIN